MVTTPPSSGAACDEPGDKRQLFAGLCRGGPMDGRRAASRFPQGFLLVYKPDSLCWVYDRAESGDFVARTDAPEMLLDSGPKNRWRAAEEPNYDIRVLDDDEGES